MNNINFRVWDKISKKIYPVTGIWFTGANNVPRKIIFNMQGWEVERQMSECVLLQSTGLTDKNGVEIYEGDILRWKSSLGDGNKKGLVHFDEGTLTYWCRTETLATLFYQQTNEHYLKKSGFKGDVPEVIGNKFENPELLEESYE